MKARTAFLDVEKKLPAAKHAAEEDLAHHAIQNAESEGLSRHMAEEEMLPSSFAQVGKPKTFEDIDDDMKAASASLAADPAWKSHSDELHKDEEEADKEYDQAVNAEKNQQRQDDEDERNWAAENKDKDETKEQKEQELEGDTDAHEEEARAMEDARGYAKKGGLSSSQMPSSLVQTKQKARGLFDDDMGEFDAARHGSEGGSLDGFELKLHGMAQDLGQSDQDLEGNSVQAMADRMDQARLLDAEPAPAASFDDDGLRKLRASLMPKFDDADSLDGPDITPPDVTQDAFSTQTGGLHGPGEASRPYLPP